MTKYSKGYKAIKKTSEVKELKQTFIAASIVVVMVLGLLLILMAY